MLGDAPSLDLLEKSVCNDSVVELDAVSPEVWPSFGVNEGICRFDGMTEADSKQAWSLVS